METVQQASVEALGQRSEDWQASGEKVEVPSFLDKKGRGPKEGQEFVFSTETPKWLTADAEFRSGSEELWPSFLY